MALRALTAELVRLCFVQRSWRQGMEYLGFTAVLQDKGLRQINAEAKQKSRGHHQGFVAAKPSFPLRALRVTAARRRR